jgi:hypothetical protein
MDGLTMRRWKIATFLFLALMGLEGVALSRSDRRPATDEAFSCGTSAQRSYYAVARGAYQESLGRGRLFSASIPSEVRADVGDVALIQDDGTILTEVNRFDLAGTAMRFEPVLNRTFKVVTSSAAFSSSGLTLITLADDDSKEIPLGFTFSFFGRMWDRVKVNSDGNLTFGESDVATSARDLGRFMSGPPRIGPFFSDLNPELGSVGYRNETDGVVFAWDRVPDYNATTILNSFSVKLFRDGRIEFAYGARVDSTAAVVGISPGAGTDEIHAVDYARGLPSPEWAGTIAEVFAASQEISETAVATRFFKNHPDEFDQLVVFLAFPYQISGAFAYELNTKNEITGIGHPLIDYSKSYGSNGRLRSFVLMGSLDGTGRFPEDPTQSNMFRTYSTLQVLAHEVAHRWLAYPQIQTDTSSPNAIIHRSDKAHWSFFFNANASVMEGNDIEDRGADRGNDRFRTAAATNKYSDLDRYLMGYSAPEEVPPMFFVDSPTGTYYAPDQVPTTGTIGTLFGGIRRDFTLDHLIAANGTRTPTVYQSPKVFRQAFILVSRAGQAATQAQIAKLQRIRDAWVPYFNQQTRGRGYAATNLQSTPGTTSQRINFPFFQGDRERYTGIAVANWGNTAADLRFQAYDNSGRPLASPAEIINPRMITIAPGAQVAMLAEQIHGLSLDNTRNGWIQVDSSSSQVSGFFLDGNVAQTVLDGAVAGQPAATTLFFTRAQYGSGIFAGVSYKNLIDVVNPGDTPAKLTLSLINEFGAIAGTAARTLPAHGRMAEELATVFPDAGSRIQQGYVKLTSDVGVIGYQSIESSRTVFALPAQRTPTATRLFSAQFASGRAGSIRYFSDLCLINTSTQSRSVQLTLTGNNGSLVAGIANPVMVSLAPGEQLRTRAESLFKLADPALASDLVEGSLVVTADGSGIIGDVTFGDPVEERFLASLPLDSQPGTRFVLSQVAQGRATPDTKPYFTGIAILNPNTTDVAVTIDVVSEGGTRTGTATLLLVAGGRIAKTLPELVPAVSSQIRGYIRLSSTGGPIVAFELFGDQNLDFLAAVPSQAISP